MKLDKIIVSDTSHRNCNPCGLIRSHISVVNLRKKDLMKKTFMKVQSSVSMLMIISGSIK